MHKDKAPIPNVTLMSRYEQLQMYCEWIDGYLSRRPQTVMTVVGATVLLVIALLG